MDAIMNNLYEKLNNQNRCLVIMFIFMDYLKEGLQLKQTLMKFRLMPESDIQALFKDFRSSNWSIDTPVCGGSETNLWTQLSIFYKRNITILSPSSKVIFSNRYCIIILIMNSNIVLYIESSLRHVH